MHVYVIYRISYTNIVCIGSKSREDIATYCKYFVRLSDMQSMFYITVRIGNIISSVPMHPLIEFL